MKKILEESGVWGLIFLSFVIVLFLAGIVSILILYLIADLVLVQLLRIKYGELLTWGTFFLILEWERFIVRLTGPAQEKPKPFVGLGEIDTMYLHDGRKDKNKGEARLKYVARLKIQDQNSPKSHVRVSLTKAMFDTLSEKTIQLGNVYLLVEFVPGKMKEPWAKIVKSMVCPTDEMSQNMLIPIR